MNVIDQMAGADALERIAPDVDPLKAAAAQAPDVPSGERDNIVDLDSAALVEKFPSSDAFALTAAPISLANGEMRVAVLDESDETLKNTLERVTRMRVAMVRWDRERITNRLRQLYPRGSRISSAVLTETTGIELWDRIQETTLRRHAQNVFIHKTEDNAGVIRWVVDNVYDDAATPTSSGRRDDQTYCAMALSTEQYEMLSRRIEEQASINEGVSSALASITLRRDVASAEGRVLRYTTTLGKTYFIRVVGSAKTLRSVEDLGMPADIRERWLAAVHGPEGLHGCVGPSGAGKNTTIAASYLTLARSRRNDVSIERPRELIIPNVRQIELSENDDPRKVLEDMLSAQPTSLYFTETKRTDIANVLSEAGRTGFQIITTWHSRSCLDAPDRLVDLGVSARNVAAALSTVLAQRLLPRLCDCHSKVPPLTLTDVAKRVLEGQGAMALVDLAASGALARANPAGCAKCAYTGYNGLIGVFELLVLDADVKRGIQNGLLPEDLLPAAVACGYKPMLQSAYEFVADKRTSLEAVANMLKTGVLV